MRLLRSVLHPLLRHLHLLMLLQHLLHQLMLLQHLLHLLLMLQPPLHTHTDTCALARQHGGAVAQQLQQVVGRHR